MRSGDILEVRVGRELAYVQYIAKEDRFGYLIRAFCGTFAGRPEDMTAILARGTQFYTYYPLGAAIRRRLVVTVGHLDLLGDCSLVPRMRATGGITRNGRVKNWWILDGTDRVLKERLSHDEKKLSIREVVNHAMLVEMIEKGWTPEQEV